MSRSTDKTNGRRARPIRGRPPQPPGRRGRALIVGWPGPAVALATLALLVMCPAGAVFGQCQYDPHLVQADPCPFVGPPVTIGHGINNLGHVAGRRAQCFVSAWEAFYWTPESGFVTMPRPDGVDSAVANDINDHGLVVGGHRFGINGPWRGFVYDIQTGAYMYLEPPTGSGGSAANAINNAGLVAGSRTIAGGNFNAVIWDTTTGEVTDLGVGQGPNSAAEDVNAQGHAGGWRGSVSFTADARALYWTQDEVIELGVLRGAVQSAAFGINNMSDAVGFSRFPNPDGGPLLTQGFAWIEGEMIHLEPPPGYSRFDAPNVSDVLQIVGTLVSDESPNITVGALWQHGNFHILNDLVELPAGVSITMGHEAANNGTLLVGANWDGLVVSVMLTPMNQSLGDLNHDCTVDVHDLLILISEWGKPDSHADLNGDGTVGVADLLILIANWGS